MRFNRANSKARTHNRLRWASLVLALLGLIDAAYLTYVKLANTSAACANIGDCDAVNNSIYSEILGIPIALLGGGAYLLIALLILLEDRGDYFRANSPIFVFGLSLVGFCTQFI